MRTAGQSAVVLDARVLAGSGGGPDKTILNSPRHLGPAGYRMLCLYLRPPGDPGFEAIRRKAADKAAPLVEVDDRGPLDWRVVPRLAAVCRRERVAVWHGHDYKTNLLGLLLARLWPMRLVTTVHGWVHHTARTPLYYGLDRLSLRHYERVLCVSDDLVRRCRGAGVPPARCRLLENGVDLDEYARRRPPAAAKARLGLDPRRPLVGAVGRLSAEKGFDRLIRAADRLWDRGADFDLVILGEGDGRPELEALADRLGRRDRVRLPGYRADLLPWYEALDVYALSSSREGMPNVVLEALAMEVPVVATRVAGVPKLIADGVDGLLVPPDDVAALADGLGRLLADADLRHRLAAAGRRTVADRFSFRARMDRLRHLYDELLAAPPRSRVPA